MRYHKVMHARQDADLAIFTCVLMTRIRPSRLQVLLAIPILPPVPSLSRLFSALERMEPSSKAFLPILRLFLRSKEERKLLERLGGSVCSRGVFACEAWADLCVVCGCAHVFPTFQNTASAPFASYGHSVGRGAYCPLLIRLADFCLANFDRSRWLGITSGSTSLVGRPLLTWL